MSDIIKETLDQIEHGCDGFTYEMYKFINRQPAMVQGQSFRMDHKESWPWILQSTTTFDSYVQQPAVFPMQRPHRTIKIELFIDETMLKEMFNGIKDIRN